MYGGGMHPHGGGAFIQQQQYDMSAGGGHVVGGGGMGQNGMYSQHGLGMPPLQQMGSQQGQGGGGRGVEGVSSGRGSAASVSPQQSSTPSPGSQHLQSPSYEPHHHMGSGYGRMGNGGGSQGHGAGYDSYSQNVADSDVYGDLPGPGSDEDMAQLAEEYVDGAVHLSAGAKPFVPKFGTSPGMPLPAVSGDLNMSSSDLHMGALSLPPMSEASSSWTLDSSSQGGLPSSWQQSTGGGNSLLGASGVAGDDDDDYNAGMDSMMHLHVPLDILSFDGIGDTMGESGDDLGESLLGRLAGGGGADRRRNRGMLFESSSMSTANSRFLDSSSTAGDDDDAILNHLISDVIASPNDNPSLSFPSPGSSLFPGES